MAANIKKMNSKPCSNPLIKWVFLFFFQILLVHSTAAQSYCNAGPTSTLDSEITGVNLKGDTDTIANYSPNCGTVGIQNFTNMTADLTKNQSYTLEVTMGSCNLSYNGALAAWIDFNNDGDFDDPNEQIGVYQGKPTSIQSWTFTVPLTAHIGWTRMRVMQQEGGTYASIAPCNTFQWGAVEDYLIQIKPANTVCAMPSNVQINMGAYTAALTWDVNTTYNSFIVEYGLTGFTLGTGDTVIVATDSAFVTGLQPGSSYDFYVTTQCSFSTSASDVTFGVWTQCAPFSTPFFEDFEGIPTGSNSNPSLPNCWEYWNDGVTYPYWYVANFSTSAHSGTNAVYGYKSPYNPSNPSYGDTVFFASPIIQGLDSATKTLEFYGLRSSTFHTGRVLVGVSNEMATTFRVLDTVFVNVGWLKFTIDLDHSSGILPGDSRIAFGWITNSSSPIYDYAIIDDVTVKHNPNAQPPVPLGGVVNPRGCIECDMLGIGDYFRINGDTMIVADRPMLDSLIAVGHDLSKVCVSHITDLSFAFDNQATFNQDVGNWDVSNVTTMNKMFFKAKDFNQDIGNWDVASVVDMSRMFQRAEEFNQDLSQWCVGSIYTSPVSFSEYTPLFAEFEPHWGLCSKASLDKNACLECDSLSIGDFFVYKGDSIEVVDRQRLDQIIAVQGDLTKICVSHVTSMKNLFRGQVGFNQNISFWDVSNVTNMNRMFKKASIFSQDISKWDVSNVNRMNCMFELASSFNRDLSHWCVRAFQYNPPTNFALNGALITSHHPKWGNCPQGFENVRSLATGAFLNSAGCVDCSSLNIGDYFELGGDTLLVVDRTMLDSLILLHDDLSKVCVSNIADMTDALRGQSWFNTDIAYWDVSNVTDMSNMFWKARIFNQDIGNWEVNNVSRMNRMFKVAKAFNQDIGGWDVSNVERFQEMFRNADAFNQDIGGWDVSSVLNNVQMTSMFRSADSFSQDLSSWCVNNVSSKPSGFEVNSSLTTNQLPVWGSCPTSGSRIKNDNTIAIQHANQDIVTNAIKPVRIDVFPNPTTGNISISPVVKGTYKIYNEVGRAIAAGDISEFLNLNGYPNGMYMLILNIDSGYQYFKIIKQ